MYSPQAASIRLNVSSIDFQIIATLSKSRMQWLKMNSKFIGILYGNYSFIMKWLPLGRVRGIGNPRRETGVCTVLESCTPEGRVRGALSWPGSRLEESAADSRSVGRQCEQSITSAGTQEGGRAPRGAGGSPAGSPNASQPGWTPVQSRKHHGDGQEAALSTRPISSQNIG